MNCADAKHLIHLDVGNDLRSGEESQLSAHMEQCGDCRSYHGKMSAAMSALLTLRDEPSILGGKSAGNSVWPAISREINRRSVSPRVVRKFNLQVVALSVCSLSLAVVTMVQSLSSMRHESSDSGFIPAHSVSHSNFGYQSQFPSPERSVRLSQASNERTPMLPHEVPATMPQSF